MFNNVKALWCSKNEHQIFLQVCIAADCKLRNKCSEYARIDAGTEAEAIADVQSHGHRAAVSPMPLLGARP
jgi:hypothetical protein